MRIIDTRETPLPEIRRLLRRANPVCDRETEDRVRAILDEVAVRGDAALIEMTRRFDGAAIDSVAVPPEQIRGAADHVPDAFKAAAAAAIENVSDFHRRRIPESWEVDRDGALLGQRIRPISSAGILVPAGQAPLPSTLLMAACPAQAAGVPRIAVCTPPGRDGAVDPHTLYVADLLGIREVYRVGGAQGVGALAYGTETIAPVDKIVGPGGIYTVTAKRLVFGQVGIESLPGPTEVVVIADSKANPAWIAADLLSQAEHGRDSLCVLLTDDEGTAQQAAHQVELQLRALDRAETASAAVNSGGCAIVCRDLAEACELAGYCAPEHLELSVEEPRRWLDRIENAGAVMLGHFTPEPVGDYLAGPSHILPTGATARFASPLHTEDFLHRMSILEYSRERFLKDAGHIIALAEAETLGAHAAAIRVRLKDLEE